MGLLARYLRSRGQGLGGLSQSSLLMTLPWGNRGLQLIALRFGISLHLKPLLSRAQSKPLSRALSLDRCLLFPRSYFLATVWNRSFFSGFG